MNCGSSEWKMSEQRGVGGDECGAGPRPKGEEKGEREGAERGRREKGGGGFFHRSYRRGARTLHTPLVTPAAPPLRRRRNAELFRPPIPFTPPYWYSSRGRVAAPPPPSLFSPSLPASLSRSRSSSRSRSLALSLGRWEE